MNSTPFVDFAAGCLGGVAGVLVGHPLDTVKVKLQTQGLRSSGVIYRGTVHCLVSTFRLERFSGLYRGISSPLSCLTLINGIVFGVYGSLSRAIGNEHQLINQLICGSAAGLAQSLVTSPMELIKTRRQLGFENTNLRSLIRSRTLYKGYCATVARDTPAFGTYFAVYQAMLNLLNEETAPSPAKHLIAGGVAGQASWLVVYPIDVAKTRIQVCPDKYKSLAHCLVSIARVEGWRSLFSGLAPTMVRAFPVNGVTFAVVSYTLYAWDRVHEYKS